MGGVTSTMAAKFAFFPPSPATYRVVKDHDTELLLLSPFPHRENVEILKLPTRKGTEIIAMYVRNPMAASTILYSHGNAADLGQMYELFIELAILLRVNIFGYDYSGYGQSSGKPSEQNTYADIEAAYKCLEESFGAKQEEIILYGQSVGSGPTLDLATRLPSLRAVVLHSPILSGLRVMYPVKRTYWFDIYKNIEKIPLVNSPVLIMHVSPWFVVDQCLALIRLAQGTADNVVDWSHGKQLWELCEEKFEPLWLEGASHCDLEQHPEYMKHLKRFISMVEKSSSSQRHDGRRSTNLQMDPSRNSTDRREKPRPSVDKLKGQGNYTALKTMDSSRRSFDCFDKTRKQPLELSRKSFDKLDRIRA